ncbi:putative sulfate exporter family transporter [Limosilactobacillus sp. STM2_1]|uniref:Putative sulfate exporter family transporter n=1 Tax=Limosilactobacillus rudii TaxID=2759755 RepID=A0A7W3UM94_9LACO|nr:putative sulfate exporter family transporter [Limosilactobacillus rudii]MBB1078740.1 putative sulfate exporter family transporter [Limosilactobacillus rudii]MBB1098172.1 putative sulfate exporter family transporter [Limosilactobacillus rudii]MCD7135244.1 putative sulfate exporter family transporter [Limosilactobacillus rudii]
MSIMKTRSFWLAAIMTLICSVAGVLLAKLPYVNLIGALVIALLLGIAMQLTPASLRNEAQGGIGFISNKFLRLGIILLGFRLNLEKLAAAGVKTILVAAVGVAGTIVLTYWLSRKFGAEDELAILSACGCGICGAAAVMGVSPQIETDDEERKRENEVLAVAVVCVMGTVFTLLEIGIKPLLGLTDPQFGIVAGGSLHEIAHAVAAGGAFGEASLDNALIMKLSRVLLLAPVALIVGYWYQHRLIKESEEEHTKEPKKLPIPWFLGGFILTSVLGTFLPFSTAFLDGLVQAAYIFLGMAMAALGVSVNFKVIFKRGGAVFGAAAISSVCLLVFMIIMSKIFF